MNQVIVAVDFSKTSINALKSAVFLANKAGADVLMVWVDNTTSEEAVYDGFPNENRNEKINLFKELQEEFQPQLPNGKISYKTKKGKVYIEIGNLARSLKTDLIFAGTHGVSGFEEFWIGSNAYRIVTHAPCPVITMRHDFKLDKIERIVIPVDSTQETRQKVPVAALIAQMFNTEVHILSLYSTRVKAVQRRVDNYAQQVIKYLEERGISYVLSSSEAENITREAIEYAENIKADLISIMTEQETTGSNLFMGPFAQQMVNHSSVPVLCVRSKELATIPV